jgi:laminin alpha 3/5
MQLTKIFIKFRFPDCLPCECNEAGSTGLSCDLKSGKCRCKPNFVGEKCDECAANLFNFPICEGL